MSVNKVILVGNVGKDPEVRYIDNNVAVANFSIATTERGYTSRSGQVVPDRTDWHNLVAWRGLAQVVEKYVKKGTQLYIEGKIRTRSYDDKDNVKRYVTEIYVDNLVLLGRKGDAQTTNQGAPEGYTVTQPQQPQSQQPVAPVAGFQATESLPPFDSGSNYGDFQFGADAADDLPF